MKKLVFLVMVFLNFQQLSALDIWGYYENQLTGQIQKGKCSFMNYNRLRIDIGSEIDENIVFKVNFIAQTFHGKTGFNLLDFIPEKFHTAAEFLHVESLIDIQFEMKDRYVLDNGSLSFHSSPFTVVIGKQQIPWGTGYIWNPTSIFHVKSILEPAYEFPGVNALRLDYGGNLSFVLAPGSNIDGSTFALRLKEDLIGFDLSASLVNKRIEERWLYGADFAGEVLGWGVWGEFAYNRLLATDYLQFVLGADYTFEFQTHIMMEYNHNGLGKADYCDYTLIDWLELLGGLQTNLGRDYIFMRASHPAMDLMEIGCSGIVNLNDRSFLVIPDLTYNLAENVDIIVMLNLFQGKQYTEYGQFPSGGFVRAMAYF